MSAYSTYKMVHITDLVNPIPEGMVFKYSAGDNVCYNGKCWVVHRQRDCDGSPSYQLKCCCDGCVVDKVLESECSDACGTEVLEEAWGDFVYTGDNAAASNFVMKRMIVQAKCLKNIEFGPNADNTKYCFKYFCDKDSVEKCLEKNKA